jgi:hypothetical protein
MPLLSIFGNGFSQNAFDYRLADFVVGKLTGSACEPVARAECSRVQTNGSER